MTEEVEYMLTTGEVAELFRVSTVQVLRWARDYPQRLGAVRMTPRGQWRYAESKVVAALGAGLVEDEGMRTR